ncbi:IniB N-terminal domain-containing protein, partial [Prescottella defluvii]|uniref:IniB N-terminal domain-containing protein n=2 Tax=Prescottella defluvii TaxID=1323361 RepID=UPI0039EB29D7
MASNAVLDFILRLLRDEDAAAAYCANPQAALSAAGLGDVCHADIAAVAPMAAESGLFGSAGADLGAILAAGTGAAGSLGVAAGGGLSGGLGLGGGAGLGLG